MTYKHDKNRTRLLSGLLLAFCFTAAWGGQPDPSPGQQRMAPMGAADNARSQLLDTIIVRFRAGVDGQSLIKRLNVQGATVAHYAKTLNFATINVAKKDLQAAIKRFKSQKDVLSVERDQRIKVRFTVNDPRSSQQWALGNVDLYSGWDYERGSSSQYIGVIDSGIDYNHEDLAAAMWRNSGEIPADGIDNDGNGWIDDVFGIDAENNDGDPMDDNNHGTHVAGIIAAAANNGRGIAGVNHRTRLIACRFLGSSGLGALSDALKCMDYFLQLKRSGVNVIATNNSWGGGLFSAAMKSAIDAHRDASIAFIAAAGNRSHDNDRIPSYPTNYRANNLLSVAALDKSDNLATFSNYGLASVHVAAPGKSILSTIRNHGYESYSGTSMAAPYAAGLYSLIAARYPTLPPHRVIAKLVASSRQLPGLSAKTMSGGTIAAFSSSNGGALNCDRNQKRQRLLTPAADNARSKPEYIVGVGTTLTLQYGYFACETGGQPSTITATSGSQQLHLTDGGNAADEEKDDGIYTANIAIQQEGQQLWHFPNGQKLTVKAITSGYRIRAGIYDWIDIHASNQATNLALGDDEAKEVRLPFRFLFATAKQPVSSLWVSSNGLISAHQPYQFAYENESLPSRSLPAFTIATYWADLNPSGTDNVYHATIGTAPARTFVIEWKNVPLFADSSIRLSYQVVFKEGSGTYQINYKEVSPSATGGGGAEATIGYQLSTAVASTYSHRKTNAIGNREALAFIERAHSPTNIKLVVRASGVQRVGHPISVRITASERFNLQAMVDYGDGTTAVVAVPSTLQHRYTTVGTFTIKASPHPANSRVQSGMTLLSIGALSLDEKIAKARQEGIDSVIANPQQYGLTRGSTSAQNTLTRSQIQNLAKGWQLLGSSNSITDLSIFQDVKVVWYYDVAIQAFKFHSPAPEVRRSLTSEGHPTIHTIPPHHGFWVFK